MATRSNIGIRETDGTVKTIYSHWDGYPQHVGRILLAHYRDEESVRALIDLGDISELHETLDKVVAYHRDRGEAKADPIVHETGEFVRGEDYAYVWDVTEGRWYWCEDDNNLKVLMPWDTK
jgi:hypothetical protein